MDEKSETSRRVVLLSGVAVVASLAGCSGGGDDESTDTPEPTATATDTATETQMDTDTPTTTPTETSTETPTETPTPGRLPQWKWDLMENYERGIKHLENGTVIYQEAKKVYEEDDDPRAAFREIGPATVDYDIAVTKFQDNLDLVKENNGSEFQDTVEDALSKVETFNQSATIYRNALEELDRGSKAIAEEEFEQAETKLNSAQNIEIPTVEEFRDRVWESHRT